MSFRSSYFLERSPPDAKSKSWRRCAQVGLPARLLLLPLLLLLLPWTRPEVEGPPSGSPAPAAPAAAAAAAAGAWVVIDATDAAVASSCSRLRWAGASAWRRAIMVARARTSLSQSSFGWEVQRVMRMPMPQANREGPAASPRVQTGVYLNQEKDAAEPPRSRWEGLLRAAKKGRRPRWCGATAQQLQLKERRTGPAVAAALPLPALPALQHRPPLRKRAGKSLRPALVVCTTVAESRKTNKSYSRVRGRESPGRPRL